MSQTDSKEVLGSGAGVAGAVAIESGTELGEIEVKARGYWEQVWRRFKRDKIAIAGGITIILLLLMAFVGAPIAAHLLGHGPDDQFYSALTDQRPADRPVLVGARPAEPEQDRAPLLRRGQHTRPRRVPAHPLRRAGLASRSRSSRRSARSRSASLLGSMAGYFRGWVDTVVSRVTEITMAFPALLFIIALASTVGDKLDNITFGGLFGTGVFTLVLIFTLFGWFYPARIIRARRAQPA